MTPTKYPFSANFSAELDEAQLKPQEEDLERYTASPAEVSGTATVAASVGSLRAPDDASSRKKISARTAETQGASNGSCSHLKTRSVAQSVFPGTSSATTLASETSRGVEPIGVMPREEMEIVRKFTSEMLLENPRKVVKIIRKETSNVPNIYLFDKVTKNKDFIVSCRITVPNYSFIRIISVATGVFSDFYYNDKGEIISYKENNNKKEFGSLAKGLLIDSIKNIRENVKGCLEILDHLVEKEDEVQFAIRQFCSREVGRTANPLPVKIRNSIITDIDYISASEKVIVGFRASFITSSATTPATPAEVSGTAAAAASVESLRAPGDASSRENFSAGTAATTPASELSRGAESLEAKSRDEVMKEAGFRDQVNCKVKCTFIRVIGIESNFICDIYYDDKWKLEKYIENGRKIELSETSKISKRLKIFIDLLTNSKRISRASAETMCKLGIFIPTFGPPIAIPAENPGAAAAAVSGENPRALDGDSSTAIPAENPGAAAAAVSGENPRALDSASSRENSLAATAALIKKLINYLEYIAQGMNLDVKKGQYKHAIEVALKRLSPFIKSAILNSNSEGRILDSKDKIKLALQGALRDFRLIEDKATIEMQMHKAKVEAQKGLQLKREKEVTLRVGESPNKERPLTENGVGVAHAQGSRPTMEDIHTTGSFEYTIRGSKHTGAFYALFDGHAGRKAAEIASSNLKTFLEFHITQHTNPKLDEEGNLFNAFKLALVDLGERCKQEDESGTTAAIVINLEGRLYVVNVGDSRVLIDSEKQGFIQATENANPSNPRFSESVIKRGSYIRNNRVASNLNVARTLGDRKVPGVTARPKVTCYDLATLGKSKVIIGCDGIFETQTSEEVLQRAKELVTSRVSFEDAASSLVDEAYRKGSEDNLSVMIFEV